MKSFNSFFLIFLTCLFSHQQLAASTR